jgi:hypothetical protein
MGSASSSPLQPATTAASPSPTDEASQFDLPLHHILMEAVVLLRSELRDCLARVRGVLVRAEDALGKLQTEPLVPELVVGSFECVDVCASYEQESSMVVDDEVAVKLMMKADIEPIVDKAPEESSVVGEDYNFGCYSPRNRSCLPLLHALPVVSECEGIASIMALALHIMPELQELCGEPSPSSPLSTMHL